MTSGSLGGMFGQEICRFSKDILKRGWVTFVGSDAHGSERRAPSLSQAYGIVQQILGKEAADCIFVENPRKVLEGEDPDPG